MPMKLMLGKPTAKRPRVQVMEIGWVGLGRMGYPIGGSAHGAGHRVRFWNRTRSKHASDGR